MKPFRTLLFIISSLIWFSLSAQNITRPGIIAPGGVKVNSYTGNMFYQRTDLFMAGRMPLDISFSYNSADRNKDRGFGKGWTFNYGMQVREDSTSVTVIHNDGRKDVFKQGQGQALLPPAGVFDSLVKSSGGTYVLRTKEGMKYFFNDPIHKMLTRQEDRNGNALVFSYTDSLMTGIADDAGRIIQLTAAGGRISGITEANGDPVRTIKYEYDNSGNLVKVTDPMGFTRQYGYVVNGPLNALTDKNGSVVDIVYNSKFAVKEIISCLTRQTIDYNTISATTYVTELVGGANQLTNYKFDAGGNLVQKTGNCCGFNVAYEYDKDKNISKLTDANGNSYTYTYDGKGNLLSETDPLGHSILYVYEPVFNQVVKQTNKSGNTAFYSYDGRGNLLQVSKPLGITEYYTYAANGDVATYKDGRGNATSFTYDGYGNITKIGRPLGSTVSYTFDARSRKLSSTDPLNHMATYSYDALDRAVKVTDALNHSSSFAYDRNGNVVTVTDANNHTSSYGYDALNRQVKSTNALGKSKNVGFDAKSNVISTTDENGNTTVYAYDKLNRLSSKTNAAGESFYYSYDGNGNLVSMAIPNGNTVAYSYDGFNRLTKSSDVIGTVSAYTYDYNGNKLSTTDGNGNTSTFTYDALNRLVSLTDALGHTSTGTYDANNNVIAVKDRNNHTSAFNYDELNRTVKKTDPVNAVTVYSYDAAGNNVAVTDANMHTTSYGYDALNRKVSETYADATAKSFTYDPVGNALTKTDPNGATTKYMYDALDRLLKRDYPGTNDDVFSYDDGGRMLTANNSDATISLTYNNANRLTGESLNGRKTGYSYNIPDKIRTVTYPGGRIIKEIYDVRESLLQVQENNNPIALFNYDAGNRNTKIAYPSGGTSTTIAYDALNRSVSMLSNPGGFLNFNYSYDNEGNKLLEKQIHAPSRSGQFAYDDFDRLSQFKKGTVSGTSIPSPITQTQYSLDVVGNRATVNQDGNVSTYTTNTTNAYTGIAGAGAKTFSFDNNGNLTFDGTNNLAYNSNDMLVSVNSGNVARYAYDALGRRIRKVTATSTVNYFYDKMQIIEECDNVNVVQASYVNGQSVDQVLTMTRGGNDYYYFYNNLGSVVALADKAGKVTEQYDYDAYGNFTIYNNLNQAVAVSGVGNTFYFTGRQYDNELGSFYYRQRHYNGNSGRFSQRDPLGFVDGPNHYAYVGNNPVNYIDPLGTVRWGDVASSAFGIVANGLGIAGGVAIAATTGFSGIGAAAGAFIAAKSAYGVYANANNLWDALNDRDPSSTGSAFGDLAKAIYPCSENLQRAAMGLDLLTDLAGLNFARAAQAAEKGVTVIGEGMARVEAEAAKIPGSRILNDMPVFTGTADEITSQMMQYNRQWILNEMRSGRTIVDIGNQIGRANPSIFYEMEQNMLKNYAILHPNTLIVIKP